MDLLCSHAVHARLLRLRGPLAGASSQLYSRQLLLSLDGLLPVARSGVLADRCKLQSVLSFLSEEVRVKLASVRTSHYIALLLVFPVVYVIHVGALVFL